MDIQIKIFQAPMASLMERSLYLKMHDASKPFTDVVPAEYYMCVFKGSIKVESLPKSEEEHADFILEKVFSIFNTTHPAGYCGRSLSVGDVVGLNGKFYLCAPVGFCEVKFATSESHPTENPTACPLVLPDGTALKVSVFKATREYGPTINIDIIDKEGEARRVCFVEYLTERSTGHELCVGVYNADSEDTAYYDSYNPIED